MSIRITGINSGMDTDSMVQELVNAYSEQGEKYTKAKTKTEWKQEAWTTLNSKIKNFYTKYASTMRFSDMYNKKSTTVSDSSKASVIAADGAVTGTQTLKVNQMAKAGYLTGGSLSSSVSSSTKLSDILGSSISDDTKITLNIGDKDLTTLEDGTTEGGNFTKTLELSVNSDTTVSDFVKQLNAIDGITASYDETNHRFFISSNESGATNNFSFSGNTGEAADVLNSLGLTGDTATKISGQDAEIILNGATFTSSSNTFSINGLTITAKGLTGDDELSLVTDTDVDTIYNNIKNFVTEYSSLINELDKLYNAESASDYEPLTDDEKEEMTDDEIEKWETKIKDSLLRRDSDIDTLASAMRSSMLKTYDVTTASGETKTYSLSSFGIETLSYFDAAENEKNAFHLDGDEDDEYTSTNTDKLRAMIASDPSAVQGFFTQLIGGLYDGMNKISSSSNNYTSYGSFYSDKKLKSDLEDQEDKIEDWEDYLADIEDRYYSQFSAMETALGELNSQQSYLSQLFS